MRLNFTQTIDKLDRRHYLRRPVARATGTSMKMLL